jgi:hypothetical protein
MKIIITKVRGDWVDPSNKWQLRICGLWHVVVIEVLKNKIEEDLEKVEEG